MLRCKPTPAHIWRCPTNVRLTLAWLDFGGDPARAALAAHRDACEACKAARVELDREAARAVHPAHEEPKA